MEDETKNPLPNEVEVTPDMIEVGGNTLIGFDLETLAYEDQRAAAVTAVFRAMWNASFGKEEVRRKG